MDRFNIRRLEGYTIMSNHHLRDQNLSHSARGLLSFMLSLPENWDYSFNGLVAISKEGKSAVRTMINELKQAKYIKITQFRDEKDEEFSNSNHSLWKDAVKKHKEENRKNNSSEELKKKHDDKEDVSEKEAFKKNRDEKKKQLYDMKRMIVEETPIAGEDTNEESFSIDESGTLKPIFDWRYVLKTNTQFDYDWSYRNSYIEDGVIDSRLEEQPFCETEILLDTSGSIEETMLRNFIMECKNILQVSRLKIGCFDTKFYGFNEIRTIDDLKNMDFIGRGGTDFNCAVNAFSFRVDNRIIFTDGYADMSNKPMDIVWMVYGDKKNNPRGGQFYYVTDGQLKKLDCVEREKVLKKYR